jgi:hypothetical protein
MVWLWGRRFRLPSYAFTFRGPLAGENACPTRIYSAGSIDTTLIILVLSFSMPVTFTF